MRAGLILATLMLGACATAPRPAPPPAAGAYAWATFDRTGITASGASGMADRARGRALTIDDPARIASISKLVVALGVMRLVEEGRLDLDRDVSEWLGWRLRNPAFPDRPITLRLLLSHRSSLQDEVDYAVPLGTSLRDRASQAAAFDAAHPPGTFFRYSNLNFPVIASVMERAAGERFDRLMARLVLQPLGLDACFNWTTCSEAAMARAVVLYALDGSVVRDDLQGRPPACAVNAPAGSDCRLDDYVLGSNGALFSPQGGLRISVRGLAQIGRLLLRTPGTRPGPLVSDAGLRTMLSPEWTYDGGNGAIDDGFYCAYGFAVQILATPVPGCRDDLFGNGRRLVGHAGDAYGLRSGLWVDRERGVGIAYLATSLGEDPPRGRTAFRTIEEWLAARLAEAPRR